MRCKKYALLLTMLCLACHPGPPSRDGTPAEQTSGVLLGTPVRVPIRWERAELSLEPLTPEDWAIIEEKFRPMSTVPGWGYLLHHLENWGPGKRFRSGEGAMDGPAMMGTVIRGEPHALFKPSEALLFLDVDGVTRFSRSTSDSGDGHPNQPLVAFAALGLASDIKLANQGSEVTIGEMVALARSEFHLKNEIEWSAMALARYAPTRRPWENRWGASQSFDRIAEEMLSKPLGQGACGGTHTLHALCVLLECDRIHGIFSAEVRDRALARLREAARLLDANARPDGYWTKDWPFGLVESSSWVDDLAFHSKTEMVQMTGHHLEWLQIAPEGIAINRDKRRSAILWCARALREVREIGASGLCPYSHCFRIVSRYLAPRKPDEIGGE